MILEKHLSRHVWFTYYLQNACGFTIIKILTSSSCQSALLSKACDFYKKKTFLIPSRRYEMVFTYKRFYVHIVIPHIIQSNMKMNIKIEHINFKKLWTFTNLFNTINSFWLKQEVNFPLWYNHNYHFFLK